jgi:hypothetical protein
MSAENSETIKRIQGVMATLERQLGDLKKAESDMNRLKLMVAKLDEGVTQTRRQLHVELAKLDPEGFGSAYWNERKAALTSA